MKVRLKLVEKSNQEARGAAFQFHEGPIKTVVRGGAYLAKLVSIP